MNDRATPPESNLQDRALFVVMATTSDGSGDPVRAFGHSDDAHDFAKKCRDFDRTFEPSPALDASDDEWERWNADARQWEASHPAAPCTRRESYDVCTVPFIAGASPPFPVFGNGAAFSEQSFLVPEGLHARTIQLVQRFASALAAKLAAAQRDLGYSDEWAHVDEANSHREQLTRAIHKGDPLDVAAYAAFLWHHGAGTTGGQALAEAQCRERALGDALKACSRLENEYSAREWIGNQQGAAACRRAIEDLQREGAQEQSAAPPVTAPNG